MKRYKIFFYLFFFWAAAVIPAHAATDYLAQMNVSRISETVDAPNFTLSDLEGRMHTLHEFKGKFVMLNFWATWWPYCDRERSSLEKIHNLLSGKGLVVLSVSVNQGSDEQVRKLVKNYVSRKKLTFLNVLDPKSLTAQEYGAQGIPVTFFINRQGKAVAVASGYRPWDSKEGLLMLEQLMSAGATTKTGKSKI